MYKVKEEVNINLIDDQLQETESNTGGLFQLYFYEKSFLPLSNSKIIKEKRLNKKTIATLLNEIFVLDKKENEGRIEKYSREPRSANPIQVFSSCKIFKSTYF